MGRTITLGLALIGLALFSRGFTQQAAAQEEPQTWEDIGQELANLETGLALNEAMFLEGQDWRWQQCRFASLEHGIWTPKEERLTALCVTQKWGPDLGTFLSILMCESGMNRLAYNPAGPYVGLAQHVLSSWQGRLNTYEPPRWELRERWRNSRSAMTISARMMAAEGTGAWSCA